MDAEWTISKEKDVYLLLEERYNFLTRLTQQFR